MFRLPIVFFLSSVTPLLLPSVSRATFVIQLDHIQVQQASLPTTVLVPVHASSTVAGTQILGFNLTADVGIDITQAHGSLARHTPGALPSGFSFPASLPDTSGTVLTGGQTAASGWSMQADASAFTLSDVALTGNRSPDGEIDISTGTVHLFSIALHIAANTAPGTTHLEIVRDEPGSTLPTITQSGVEVPTFQAGSITIVGVPEPNPVLLLLGVGVAFTCRRYAILRV